MDAHSPQDRTHNVSEAGQDDPVKDVSLDTFMVEVIEASRQRLVIVDFWAPWCGPCKSLGPALVNAVTSYKGAVRLAKVDIDKNPEIAQQMRIQSIPAVFAFFGGKPIDGFMGALPEKQIKAWIDRLIKALGDKLPRPGGGFAEALQQAEAYLAEGDHQTAQTIYEGVLTDDPRNTAAKTGLARCKNALDLAGQVKNAAGDIDALSDKVNANPDDHQSRFDLALAYFGAGRREEAVDALLEIVRRNRKWNDEAARKQLVKFFEAFGFSDPLSVTGRKRLSSILFS